MNAPLRRPVLSPTAPLNLNQAAVIAPWAAEAFRADVEAGERENAERSAAVETLMRAGRFHLLARPGVTVEALADAGALGWRKAHDEAPVGASVPDLERLGWRGFVLGVVAKADELAAKKVA